MGGQDGWGALPFEKMIAVLRYRGLDGEAMRLAQERQVETMREAAELLSRTAQDIGTRQAALFRETVERMMATMPGQGGDASMPDLARRQMDASRQQVEASVATLRAISELMWDCGRSTLDLMNRTMTETVEAMTKVNGASAGEAPAKPAREKAASKRKSE